MIKKILLSVMLMFTWMGTVKAEGGVQTQTLTVFDSGNKTNQYLPVWGYSTDSYQKCEMIYPAENLNNMAFTSISRMDFYTSTAAKKAWTATFQVYLKEVSQSAFPSENPTFIDFSENDLVYEGLLDATGEVMSIVFDSVYYYQGGNLLVGIYVTQKGNYSRAYFRGEDVSHACIYGKLGASLDQVLPNQGNDKDFFNFLPKTTFHFEKNEPPALYPPIPITTSDITENSATISWVSCATKWQICINDDEENLIDVEEDVIDVDYKTKTYLLTDLEADHIYKVKIRAVNGTQVSKWSDMVSIRTLSCSPDQMVNISYELHDKRGDGWQGSAIIVKDASTNEELATWTVKSGSSSASGTLPVGLGRKLKFEFVWIQGTYTQDCSYEVYDPNGEIIFEGTRDQVDPINYTVSAANPRPTDLRVPGIGIDRAIVYWSQKGDAAQWQLCINNDLDHLILVSSKLFMLTNLEDDTNYTLMVRAYKDADNISKWSEPVSFTTKEVCPKPTNLKSEPGSTDAVLSWDGALNSYVLQYNVWCKLGDDVTAVNSRQTYTFNLRYFRGKGSIAIRHYNVADKFWLHIDDILVTDAEGTTVYSEDFENSEGYIPAKLSTIDHDGDGYGWEIKKNEGEWRPFEGGDYGISSATYKADVGGLSPDDWLIISDVELGGILSFMAYGQTYNDNFAVYVMADDYMKEVPISNSTSYHATRLINNLPYSWWVKGVRGSVQSRWASSLFETPYDPYAIATGIQTIDNGQLTMDNYTDEWYTIEGQKLSGKPTKKGVYIYNGKRVVIR